MIADLAEINGKASKASYCLRAIDEILVQLHPLQGPGVSVARAPRPVPVAPPPRPEPVAPPPPAPAAPVVEEQPPEGAQVCGVCGEWAPHVGFPEKLVGCTCDRYPVEAMDLHQPVTVCLGCMWGHFGYVSKCPGPCSQRITAVLFVDGSNEPVPHKDPNVEGAIVFSLEEFEQQERDLENGIDHWAVWQAHQEQEQREALVGLRDQDQQEDDAAQ